MGDYSESISVYIWVTKTSGYVPHWRRSSVPNRAAASYLLPSGVADVENTEQRYSHKYGPVVLFLRLESE